MGSPGVLKTRVTVRAALSRRDPIPGSGGSRLRFQKFVGPLRYAKSGEGFPAVFNQAAVKLDKGRTRFEIEHGVKVIFQQFAALAIRRPWVEILQPSRVASKT